MGIYAIEYSRKEWGVAVVEAKNLKAAKKGEWEMILDEMANKSDYDFEFKTLESYKKKYGRDYYG